MLRWQLSVIHLLAMVAENVGFGASPCYVLHPGHAVILGFANTCPTASYCLSVTGISHLQLIPVIA